jgi:predicted GTPase
MGTIQTSISSNSLHFSKIKVLSCHHGAAINAILTAADVWYSNVERKISSAPFRRKVLHSWMHDADSRKK